MQWQKLQPLEVLEDPVRSRKVYTGSGATDTANPEAGEEESSTPKTAEGLQVHCRIRRLGHGGRLERQLDNSVDDLSP
jgi:hypothetical protein